VKLKNPWTVFLVILTLLAALALYKSGIAYQHRNLGEAFILLVIAAIFVRRVQTRS
jgi:hypothetical protein